MCVCVGVSCYVGRREGGMNGFSLEEVGVMGRELVIV